MSQNERSFNHSDKFNYFQKNLDDHTVVLCFTNTRFSHSMIQIIMDKKNIKATELNTDKFLEEMQKTIIDISQKLYNLLFDHIETFIENKKTLLVIPEGFFALIPFECLIMPDKRYLIERFHIQYIPSIRTFNLIEKRQYKGNGNSILAFGGAIYNNTVNSAPTIENEKQLDIFIERVIKEIESGNDLSDYYTQLGYGGLKIYRVHFKR